MALLCLHRLVANDDSGLERLVARKGEVVRGVETVGSLSLKSERQPAQKCLYRAWPQAIAHTLDLLVWKPAGHVGFGV